MLANPNRWTNSVSGILTLAILLGMALPSQALTAEDPIDTNRPSFMDSPLVVPQGSLQAENGTLFQGFQHKVWQYDVPETEVRVGLLKNTELQLFVPADYLRHVPGLTKSYTSDLTEVGIKSHWESKSSKYNIAFIGAVTPPTGSKVISGSGVEGTFRIPWTVAINNNWSIMGMQSLLILNHAKNVQWQPDFMLGRNIGSKTSVFIEYGGFYTTKTLPQSIIHFGAVYKVTPRQQVDVHFGFGMNQAAPSAFVGTGYSVRLDWLAKKLESPQQTQPVSPTPTQAPPASGSP